MVKRNGWQGWDSNPRSIKNTDVHAQFTVRERRTRNGSSGMPEPCALTTRPPCQVISENCFQTGNYIYVIEIIIISGSHSISLIHSEIRRTSKSPRIPRSFSTVFLMAVTHSTVICVPSSVIISTERTRYAPFGVSGTKRRPSSRSRNQLLVWVLSWKDSS